MTGLVVLLVVALVLVGGYEWFARRSGAVDPPLGRWSDALRRLAGRLPGRQPARVGGLRARAAGLPARAAGLAGWARGLVGLAGRGPSGAARVLGPDDVAALLRPARSVVVVPGYGLAAAQGQRAARDLAAALSARGADVTFAVHPAAGRMPGHLDTVLDDARVPPAAVVTGPEAAARLRVADVALVVGAGDVVSPASGLVPLPVTDAAHVVVLTRDTGAGRSGAANPLVTDPAVGVLRGDARESLARVLAAVGG